MLLKRLSPRFLVENGINDARQHTGDRAADDRAEPGHPNPRHGPSGQSEKPGIDHKREKPEGQAGDRQRNQRDHRFDEIFKQAKRCSKDKHRNLTIVGNHSVSENRAEDQYRSHTCNDVGKKTNHASPRSPLSDAGTTIEKLSNRWVTVSDPSTSGCRPASISANAWSINGSKDGSMVGPLCDGSTISIDDASSASRRIVAR